MATRTEKKKKCALVRCSDELTEGQENPPQPVLLVEVAREVGGKLEQKYEDPLR